VKRSGQRPAGLGRRVERVDSADLVHPADLLGSFALRSYLRGSDRKRPELRAAGGDTGIGPADRRYSQEQDSCEQESAERWI
jgi:hypothetical protein